MKTCTSCGEAKPLDEFYRSQRSRDGHEGRCKACRNAQYRAYYAVHSRRLLVRKVERHRERRAEDVNYYANLHLRHAFGMTVEDYDAKLAAQGGRCMICRSDDPGNRWGPRSRFHFDHDHNCCPGWRSCGLCIRDLLCTGCNSGTGIADKPDLLRKRADYVERWREIHRIRRHGPTSSDNRISGIA